MEQIVSTFGIDWKLLIAQSVNFVVLLVALSYFLYKPVLGMLEKRETMLKKQVEDSEAATTAREATESERSGIIAAAEAAAQELTARAAAEGKRERESIVKAAQDRAEAALKDADAQAKEAKRRAIAESEKEIARAAVLAAEKILKES